MYEINKMTSFAEFDKYFCNIAHLYGNGSAKFDSGETIQRWEQVDDRFHSFYGSTYEVPLEPIKQREEVIKIAIIGDKWLMSENVFYKTSTYDKLMLKAEDKLNRVEYYSLAKELRDIFQTATIDVIGDYSDTATELNTLDKVLTYVKAHKDIDYLICNGIENTTDSRKKLKELDEVCLLNNIKCCVVGTPRADIDEDVAERKPIIANSEYTKSVSYDDYGFNLFCIDDFLYKHLNIQKYNCAMGESNAEQKIRKEYGWLYITKMDEPLSQKYFRNYIIKTDDYTQRYTEFIYNKIKRYVIENLFNIKKNSYYLTFNHYFVGKNMNDTIYAKYFGAWTAYTKRDGKTNETSYKDGDIHGAWRYNSKYCNDGRSWNLFKNSGEIITVTASLGFSETSFSCEYFGANCYDEWKLGNDDASQFCNLLKIREWCPSGGHEVQMVSPPVFHNTGSPWFVISEENKEQYKNRQEVKCPIEFIVHRDNTSASVIMHLDQPDNGEKEIYSAISFGRFEKSHKETNTKYSLYVAGGTTALANDIYVYQPAGGGCLTYVAGNVYDLNVQNIAMSNSDIINPTQFYDAQWSNFKVLCEDSKWRSIYTLQQGAEVKPYPVCGGCAPTFATRLAQPSDYTPDFILTKNSMRQKKRFFVNQIKNENKIKEESREYNIQMDDISVAVRGQDQVNYILGSISDVYIHYDYQMPLGIIELNDGIYFNLPCVWDERLYHYKIHLDVVNEEWEHLLTVEEYEKQKMDEKRNKILYRTLIRLGDS
jgi:hypothetical protein|nr:MAG TPA: hypothetical protein [Caudoviricetes sp.]